MLSHYKIFVIAGMAISCSLNDEPAFKGREKSDFLGCWENRIIGPDGGGFQRWAFYPDSAVQAESLNVSILIWDSVASFIITHFGKRVVFRKWGPAGDSLHFEDGGGTSEFTRRYAGGDSVFSDSVSGAKISTRYAFAGPELEMFATPFSPSPCP